MGDLIIGGFLIGIGLIIDAFQTTLDFCRGSYLDKLLNQKVWDAFLTFTIGMIIIGALVWFITSAQNCDQ